LLPFKLVIIRKMLELATTTVLVEMRAGWGCGDVGSGGRGEGEGLLTLGLAEAFVGGGVGDEGGETFAWCSSVDEEDV
jgi:hypothetical protein